MEQKKEKISFSEKKGNFLFVETFWSVNNWEKLKRQVFRLKTGDDITLVYLLSNIKGENFVKKVCLLFHSFLVKFKINHCWQFGFRKPRYRTKYRGSFMFVQFKGPAPRPLKIKPTGNDKLSVNIWIKTHSLHFVSLNGTFN